MRNLPTCHGCERGSDLISCWGQLWCPDCLAREGKAAAGCFDERVWPETEQACSRPFDWERNEDFIPNHDEIPEGGLVCAFDAQALQRHFAL